MNLLGRFLLPTLIHFTCVLVAANGGTLAERFISLFQFDSYWFESISRNGYVSNGPMSFPLDKEHNNVAFYPGYSLIGYLLSLITRMAHWVSLLIASFLFTIGFWYFLAKFSQLVRLPASVYLVIVGLILAYPGTFFLTTAYAESMMLCFGMALLCEAVKEKEVQTVKASCCGFITLLSHIRGVFFLVPAICVSLSKLPDKIIRKLSVILASSFLAPISFYTYCWWRWGKPFLMEETTSIGWYHRGPDLLWPFQLSHFRFTLKTSTGSWYASNPLEFGQVLGTTVTVLILGMLFWSVLRHLLYQRDKQFPLATYLYLSACIVHYGMLAAMATNPVNDTSPMYSYIRHGFLPWLLLVLALGCDMRDSVGYRRWLRALPAVTCALPWFVTQWYFIQRFTRGIWVS